MNLGISSWSFTWAVGIPGYTPENPMNEIDILHKAKSLNLNLFQIADNLPPHSFDDQRLLHFKQKADELGITIEVGACGLTSQKVNTYIQIAKKLDSKILRFVPYGDNYTPSLDKIIAVCKESVPELKSNNIILALENHEKILSTEFAHIIESVGSEHVGICLDCANSLGDGEGFREIVTNLAQYTVNFHLKEVFIKRKYHKMGFEIEGAPFGKGILPLKWMLLQLPPKCNTAILEQWTPPEKTVQENIEKEAIWVEKNIQYLREFFID